MSRKTFKHLSEIFESNKLYSSVNQNICQLKVIQIAWREIQKSTPMTQQLCSFFEHSYPTSVQGNTLFVACDITIIVNHARYIQDNILKQLSKQGISQISKIHIQHANSLQPTQATQATQSTMLSPTKTKGNANRPIDPECLHTLERFTQSCESDVLKASVEKLLSRMEKQKTEK